jgi:hypothetical protein
MVRNNSMLAEHRSSSGSMKPTHFRVVMVIQVQNRCQGGNDLQHSSNVDVLDITHMEATLLINISETLLEYLVLLGYISSEVCYHLVTGAPREPKSHYPLLQPRCRCKEHPTWEILRDKLLQRNLGCGSRQCH